MLLTGVVDSASDVVLSTLVVASSLSVVLPSVEVTDTVDAPEGTVVVVTLPVGLVAAAVVVVVVVAGTEDAEAFVVDA